MEELLFERIPDVEENDLEDVEDFISLVNDTKATQSLFDVYSMDFYENTKKLECEGDQIMFSSCGSFYVRSLNEKSTWNGPKEFAENIRDQHSIYFKKSQRVHFTFQRIAKNYEKWLLFLRNCGFYYKGQVQFPEYILYEKKKNQKNYYETTTLPGYHSYTSYTNFTRTPDSAKLG